MNTTKLLIIAVALLVLVGGTFLVYNLFFKSSSPGDGNEPTNALPSASAGATSLPTSGNGSVNGGQSGVAQKIRLVSQEPVLSPAIGEDGKTVKYYTRSNGRVLESDFIGNNLKEISSVTLNGLLKALWSPDKTKTIGVFSDNNAIKKYFYDYNNNQSALLNDQVGYVAWSPDSKRIAYQFIDQTNGQHNISVANPDGSSWKNIFKTRLDNLIVEWPSKEKISLRQPPSGLAQGILYAINSDTGDFNKILSDLFGLNVKWSPRADKILFSSTNDRGKNPQLFLTDASGTNLKNLKLTGLADKCVWSNDDRTIFCALPQEMSTSAVWPDDYYKGLVILADDFYKINLESDTKTKILGSSDEASFDAQELFLSPKEDYLFFVNKHDGLLYSLKI
ncbi:hypothetical protein KJ784_02105 [Patescibacteria group bacterium]|nr:hypothetical protein [Patescibacteria group bacterium]